MNNPSGRASLPVKSGDLFRQYRIVEKVGEGGMGTVYRAHDATLGRDVALKFLLHEHAEDTERRDRLYREARALAALNHPNIVTIHEIGESGGTPFLVLEWLEGGGPNAERFRRPLLIGTFLDLALPVARALGAAHPVASSTATSNPPTCS